MLTTSEDESSFLKLIEAETDGFYVPNLLRNKYEQDIFFANIPRNSQHYKNFQMSRGLLVMKNSDLERLCVLDICVGERSICEIIILHAHSLLAHLGAAKTLGLLCDHV